MVGQKEAVVVEVTNILGARFTKFLSNAVELLSTAELETVKRNITNGIITGNIEYSKDRTKTSEVTSYARSMVMNHLKKARELNGNSVYTAKSSNNGSTSEVASLSSLNKTNKGSVKTKNGINTVLLPEELKELLTSL